MNNVKDIWQEAYDSAREQGMSEMMARDHADDKLAALRVMVFIISTSY